MKITYPFMGTTLIYKKLFELLGHEVVQPPRPTKRTIDLGVKYSPEFACFPYKVLLGTYIEAIETGADTIVTSGGSGPCRAGLYAEIQAKTLKRLGYQVNFIVFDDIGRDPQLFLKNLKKLHGKNSVVKTVGAIYTAYKIACSLEKLNKFVEIQRAYEIEKGSFTKAFEKITRRYDQEIFLSGDINKVEQESLYLLKSIPTLQIPEKQKIRIGIVGEIYVVMESSINMNIAETLNHLGCEVNRSMYISEWVDHNIWPKWYTAKSDAKIIREGKRYFPLGIGGHERHNIGNIIIYKKHGYDGVIHLMPFGCLPELVTQSIMPRVSNDYEIPVLTLALDEQTGMANNLTRLEAFVELIRNLKKVNLGFAQK